MIRGLLRKTWHEVWLTTLIIGVALLGVNAMLTRVVPRFLDQGGIEDLYERAPFVQNMVMAMLGTEFGQEKMAEAMNGMLWVHPTVLTLLWAHAIVFCSRFPAAEVDRGTVDILLGLPVSRRKAYYSEVLAWALAGLFLIAMGFAGHRLSAPAMPENMRPSPTEALYILTNLYFVYFAVGSFAFLISANSDRRGRAIAVTIALVLASFLLSFLAQFWEPAQAIAWMSILEYYRPAEIFVSEQFATANVVTLIAVGTTALMLGGEIVAHRSMCTT